jgi:sugar phosphate isomerase/epimerase
VTRDAPKFSVCQLAMPNTTMAEDIRLCADLGIKCIGLDENKMVPGGDSGLRDELLRLGVAAGICSPATLSLLPSPVQGGSPDPELRVQSICESISRFAPFCPDTVFVLTGPLGRYDERTGRKIVVDGLREAVKTADQCGVPLSVEPMRTSHHDKLSFIHSLPDMLSLIDDVGDTLKITYDVWHLWDSEDVLPLTRKHGSAIAGVQISDYRQPTRVDEDRLLPGHGVIDLPRMFGTLEAGGYSGWYDLEVFSDLVLPDSIWKRPPYEWIEEGRQGFLSAWARRTV